ncbi:MAG: hypothetical protein IT567_07075 [Alphaproteobacteria bacterium]|nr:hypothetical protein [Alphaproteobacteria bacterium]
MPFVGDNELAAKLVHIKGLVMAKSDSMPATVITPLKEGLDQLAVMVTGMDITEGEAGKFSIPGHHRPGLGAQAFIGHRALPVAEGLRAIDLVEEAKLVENLTRAIATAWDVSLPAQRAL